MTSRRSMATYTERVSRALQFVPGHVGGRVASAQPIRRRGGTLRSASVGAAEMRPVPLTLRGRYAGAVENTSSAGNMVLPAADWSETTVDAIDYLRTYYTGNLHVVFQAVWFAANTAGAFNAFNQPEDVGTGTDDAVGLATVPTFPNCTLIGATASANVAWSGATTAPLRQGLWWANAADLGAPGAETIDLTSLYGVSANVIVMATIGDATRYVAWDSVEYGAGATGTIPALPGDYAAGILEPPGTYFSGSIITPDVTTSDAYVYTSSAGAADFGYLRAVAVA